MLTPGTQLQQRYRINQRVGQGGMGAVYAADDQRLHRPVAVKQLLLADPVLIKAFAHEAQLLGTLHHPCLPRVSDHFVEGDISFLVMDYIVTCPPNKSNQNGGVLTAVGHSTPAGSDSLRRYAGGRYCNRHARLQ